MRNSPLPMFPGTLKTPSPILRTFKRKLKISKMAGSDFRETMAPFSDAFSHRGEARVSSKFQETSATI